MTRPHLLLAAGVLTLLSGGCRSASTLEKEAEARAQAKLARWFPEARQPVDRASLLSALVPPTPVETPAGSPQEAQVRSAVQAALAETDYQKARDLLVELLGPRELDLAERVLESGDAARALALLDRCARTNPESPRLFGLRARARYLVGIEQGADGRELVQASLEDGLRSARVRGGADDWTQASASAFWLGEVGAARAYSEKAVENAASRADGSAERQRAAASVAEFHALASGDRNPDELAADAARTRRALEEYLGFAPFDLWAWQQLTAILEAHELAGRAAVATARALEFAPSDAILHERYARLSLALGGRDQLLAVYEGFAAQHPEVGLAAWYPAVQHYEAGCELVAAQRNGRARFEAADRLFAHAVELDSALEAPCAEYRAACRVGIGWSLIESDVEASEAAFHAAGTLAGGRALPAGLPSGVAGLERLAAYWVSKDLDRASALYEELHRLAPENADWANNAGFFLRDTAVELETRAVAACKRGAREEGAALLRDARDRMERSYAAYKAAVALAPEDVRLLNDCALILANYLQRDADEAESTLRHAIELGEGQLPELSRAAAEEGLDAEQKSQRQRAQQELVSAVGDAFQNLGVVYLTLRGDAQTGLGYLERCRGMGPDPRPEVNGPGGFLEQARAALAGTLDPRVTDATRWAAPCKDK